MTSMAVETTQKQGKIILGELLREYGIPNVETDKLTITATLPTKLNLDAQYIAPVRWSSIAVNIDQAIVALLVLNPTISAHLETYESAQRIKRAILDLQAHQTDPRKEIVPVRELKELVSRLSRQWERDNVFQPMMKVLGHLDTVTYYSSSETDSDSLSRYRNRKTGNTIYRPRSTSRYQRSRTQRDRHSPYAPVRTPSTGEHIRTNESRQEQPQQTQSTNVIVENQQAEPSGYSSMREKAKGLFLNMSAAEPTGTNIPDTVQEDCFTPVSDPDEQDTAAEANNGGSWSSESEDC